MKFRCERDALADALSVVSRAVSMKVSGLPALGGLIFKTEGEGLTISGTDLDLSIQVNLLASVLEDGSCLIPAKLVTDIVKSLPSGSVTLETDGFESRVGAGHSQFSIRNLDAQEFPEIAEPVDLSDELPTERLAEAFRQVVKAAGSDEARPVLTSVLMSTEGSGLRLVASDSYRLAVRDIPGVSVSRGLPGQLEDSPTAYESVLIPSRSLTELARLLSSGSESLRIALHEKVISFALESATLSTRLIEGNFPDYRPLIPKSYPNRLLIDRDSLTDAVRRVRLIARDSTTPVRMNLWENGVELTVVNQEVGQAVEEVEAKYQGEPMSVAFNPTFLLDGLEVIPPGNVTIDTIDSLKPATMRPEGVEDFLYLLMPIRVS